MSFQTGEYVDITIKGARVDEWNEDVLSVELAPGLPYVMPIDLPLVGSVTVERVAPAEWPPQPRDLWRDQDGDLWFGYLVSHDGEEYVRLQCSTSGKEMAWLQELDEINRKYGPLVLVRREGAYGAAAESGGEVE